VLLVHNETGDGLARRKTKADRQRGDDLSLTSSPGRSLNILPPRPSGPPAPTLIALPNFGLTFIDADRSAWLWRCAHQ
jgi:hypothetical protein